MPIQHRILVLFLALLLPGFLQADEGDQTVGWFHGQPASFDGYSFFAPGRSTTTYLVDEIGRVVHSWPSAFNPGNAAYLLQGGQILRAARIPGNLPISAGGVGGRVERIAWDGTLLWQFDYSSNLVQHHHDVEQLPNGNVLLIAWELKTAAQALAAGRDPSMLDDNELWPDHIIEVAPTSSSGGTIVWQWHAWDHLIQELDPTRDNFGVVADHPEKIHINYDGGSPDADWLHFNSIDYNADLDQILVSVPTFGEVWIIDHSTTTTEAAGSSGGDSGHGGDLLYRWGNPRAYQAGTIPDQVFFFQHGSEWIGPGLPGEGNLIVFNNGVNRPGGNASSADEFIPPIDVNGDYILTPGSAYGPSDLEWTYMAPDPGDLFGRILGGVQRLPNGNTLICEGAHGIFVEVTEAGQEAWRYVNPVGPTGTYDQGETVPGNANSTENSVFRVHRFGASAVQLAGLDLTPGDPLENYPTLGDFDNSGAISMSDHDCFSAVFTGPCPTEPCPDTIYGSAMAFYGDFDSDGDVDCDDWDSFVSVWDGPPTTPPDLAACSGSGDPEFTRGDANQDGTINIADVVTILGHLFQGQGAACLLSFDTNDDESTDISDAVALLTLLFGGGSTLPAPYPDCGPDGTPGGGLSCETAPNCP
ncbi:MAG: aryl-sulfate sulfotransferase [Planctomycetota bacterium]|nr:aryl-sulfate sulfotransferase [Planctomycetota bacterium]